MDKLNIENVRENADPNHATHCSPPHFALPISCPPLSVTDWAHRINFAWSQGAASTLELTRAVCAARRSLAYGEWARLWESKTIGFSKRKGDMLATIGKNLGQLTEQNSAHLPAAWNTLYCLSLIDLSALEKLAQEGVVHLGLTLREATELLAQHRGKRLAPFSKTLGLERRLKNFATFVEATLQKWTPAERRLAKAELRDLLYKINDIARKRDRLFADRIGLKQDSGERLFVSPTISDGF
jgi:hypothetical protein